MHQCLYTPLEYRSEVCSVKHLSRYGYVIHPITITLTSMISFKVYLLFVLKVTAIRLTTTTIM